jgi:hypothetical protein
VVGRLQRTGEVPIGLKHHSRAFVGTGAIKKDGGPCRKSGEMVADVSQDILLFPVRFYPEASQRAVDYDIGGDQKGEE